MSIPFKGICILYKKLVKHIYKLKELFMKIKNILLFALLFIWQIPQNLVAVLMLPFLCHNLRLVCYRNFCLCYTSSNMEGGISLGNFAFVSNKMALMPEYVSHEVDGHTKQSKILGPLYLFVVGIPSILWASFRNRYRHPDYYSFYTEKWANNCAGLKSVCDFYGIYHLMKK